MLEEKKEDQKAQGTTRGAARGIAQGAAQGTEYVMSLLKHRYPMLLIDRILSLDVEGEKIHALKNVSINEPFFQGHFPERPIMPGVFLLEALAQAAWALQGEVTGAQSGVFMGADSVRFRKLVQPGDTLHLHVTGVRVSTLAGRFSGEIFVEDVKVAEAMVLLAVVDSK